MEVIWPESPKDGVLPLRSFVQEVLRRSKSSYSVLQVALYYMVMLRPFVPRNDDAQGQLQEDSTRFLRSGRRMFLAALMLASKYLQDRNYSARAWSKISGLKPTEISQIEVAFLKAIGGRLHIPTPMFEKWTNVMLGKSWLDWLTDGRRKDISWNELWKSQQQPLEYRPLEDQHRKSAPFSNSRPRKIVSAGLYGRRSSDASGNAAPSDYWTGGPARSRSASHSSSMNSSLHGYEVFDPQEQNWNPQEQKRSPNASKNTVAVPTSTRSSTLPPPPVKLGTVSSFECDICGKMIKAQRKRDWQ